MPVMENTGRDSGVENASNGKCR